MGHERQYWLGFNLVAGVGPVRIRRLLELCGTLEAAWTASPSTLKQAGLDTRAITNLRQARQTVDLDDEMARLDKLGVAIFTWNDDDYPTLLTALREIDQAPPLLYVRGTLSSTDDWAVAVVGTRNVSAYGRQVTYQIAGSLAAAGLTVVSGLAHGVDSEAHTAALDKGGRTIAVLPCGIDDVYPPENRALAARIIEHGAVLSIFPPGTAAETKNFAPRNQVISGLARGVLVTEAGDKSGAMLTANFALEHSREVFAVPGNITAHGSSGTNRLIQDGATPVVSAKDILDAFGADQIEEHVEARKTLPALSEDERVIIETLGSDALHADEIVRASSLPVARVTSALTMLELKGIIRQVGNMTYARL